MRSPHASRPLALLLLLPLALGAAAAGEGWRADGQHEPDTAHDLGWHWSEADADANPNVRRVHFNAYPVALAPEANANAGELGARLEPPGAVRWHATLGVWKDCNGDGYLGLGATGAREYPAALLMEDAVCRMGDAHNDGTLVRELLWLATPDAAAAAVPRAGEFLVPGTLAWGDVGAPGEGGFEACPVHPLARGTTSNTGLLLRHADCGSQHRLVGLVNTVDNDGALGLMIRNPDRPEESDSRLVLDLPAHPYESPTTGRAGLLQQGSGRPTFSAWDCAEARPAPAVAGDPLDASLVDALGSALDALAGDCDPQTAGLESALDLQAAVERPYEPTQHDARDKNDVVLRYHRAPAPPGPLVLDPWGSSASGAGGVGALSGRGAGWIADETFAGAPRAVDRTRLEVEGARHWTFYARLGPAAADLGLQAPSPATGAYGAEACARGIGAGAGVQRGWACDPAAWWRDAGGSTRPADAIGAPLGAVPGDPYHLRDVDSLDAPTAPLAPRGGCGPRP